MKPEDFKKYATRLSAELANAELTDGQLAEVAKIAMTMIHAELPTIAWGALDELTDEEGIKC